jgi:hypothetical protein
LTGQAKSGQWQRDRKIAELSAQLACEVLDFARVAVTVGAIQAESHGMVVRDPAALSPAVALQPSADAWWRPFTVDNREVNAGVISFSVAFPPLLSYANGFLVSAPRIFPAPPRPIRLPQVRSEFEKFCFYSEEFAPFPCFWVLVLSMTAT